jgi:hypothetical protein
MPKSQAITIGSYPEPSEGELYPGLVFHMEKKSKALLVRIRNLHPQQEGRVHELEFALPVLPESRAAEFLRAAGIAVAAGARVELRGLLGKTVLMQFGPGRDGKLDVVSFTKPKENKS